MLRKVKLYGHLGKRFGRTFEFHVRTPIEAVEALKANLKGFEAYMIEYSAPGYKVFSGKDNVTEKELGNPSAGAIKIVPVVAGAGNGVGQFILGAVLLAVSFVPGFQMLAGPGIALMLGGVVQMLFSPPIPTDPGQMEKTENRPSYSFNGAVNTSRQGNPISVGYGRLIIGSQVIGAGIYVDSI